MVKIAIKETPKTGIKKCTNRKELEHLVPDCWFLLEKEKNKTGTSLEEDKCPHEVWYKKGVNLNNFKIFGSRVSVYVPEETRRQWYSRSKEGIFLGYSEEVKGYRIFFLDKNKVECHRDIIFLPKRNHKPIENNGSNLIYNDTSERGYLQDNENLTESTNEKEEPETFEEAMHTNQSTEWKEAIEAKISALQENDMWVCEEDETGENKVIECKRVFKRKKDEYDKIVSYKATGFSTDNLVLFRLL
ncbi:hypothetical protein JTB14_005491 [Gonioctena quinquepunctata]|nr:hypothetical protein JTB14_005491 [Gonioctena quinquepunctata]